jgi:PPOX class probable F420-dependent enzyme
MGGAEPSAPALANGVYPRLGADGEDRDGLQCGGLGTGRGSCGPPPLQPGSLGRFESILGRITMSKLSDSMRELLNGRHYATLATLNEDGSIHLTPVWYLFENKCLFIETAASDRKVRNILARPEASLIVDIRKLGSERWVSGSGTAEIIHGERSKEINAKIQQRYLTKAGREDPRVGPVLAAGSEVTISLTPHSWRSFELKSFDDQFFGGILGQTPEKWFLPLD